jgi:hypothetical protein
MREASWSGLETASRLRGWMRIAYAAGLGFGARAERDEGSREPPALASLLEALWPASQPQTQVPPEPTWVGSSGSEARMMGQDLGRKRPRSTAWILTESDEPATWRVQAKSTGL